MRIKYLLSLASLAFMVNVFAQTNYQMPPKEILELADTKAPAQNLITKSNKYLMQIERPLYKSLDELAEPELRLAGLRINPENFNQARGTYYTGIKLFSLPDAKEIPVTGLPQNLKMQSLSISPQETHLAFIQVLPNDLELWILDLKTGIAKNTNTHHLNAVLGAPVQWDADGQSLLVKSKGEKGKFPDTRVLPKGPATQDATGTKAPARTFQDLLRNKQDEAKFDYYAMANITRVYLNGTPGKTVLPEAVYKRVSLSPDGKNLMSEEVKQP